MRIEAMHSPREDFRLIGYRIVAENGDEERILELNDWKVSRENFSQKTAIHLTISTTPRYVRNTTANSVAG